MANPEDEINFPPNMPEELKEHIKQQHAQNDMARTAYFHNIFNFLDGMSSDQLLTMLHILGRIANAETPDVLAASYYGHTAGILQAKHNICPACEKNHEAEFFADDTEGATNGNGN